MLTGAKTVWVPTDPDISFIPVNLAEYITKKTRIIVVNSPCNLQAEFTAGRP